MNEEYKDCKSLKSRFNQYFIHGESLDCSSWYHDYENCLKWESKKDLKAAKEIIDSESKRRNIRLKNHYGNDIWRKRKTVPEDWAKPLPENISKEYENSYLDIKSKEMKGIIEKREEERTLCVVM